MSKVSIIGSGFVGFEVGKGLLELKNEVIFQDISDTRLDDLSKQGFNTTREVDYAVKNSDITFIVVPTPVTNEKFDSHYIESATQEVGKGLKQKTIYHLIVVKSTVLPGMTEEVVIPIIEKFSGKKTGKDFGVCMNPEFLTQISNSWTSENSFKRNFFSDERIIIGELDEKSGNVLEELYSPLKIPIFRMKIKDAEFLKYSANCALSARISYWNQIFIVGKALGINDESIEKIAEIVGMDPRIGKYGTVLGKAFGGKCLPKDLQALIGFLEEKEIDAKLLESVSKINKHMAKNYGIRE